MPVETLEDIVEQIMDGFGVYGAHDDRCNEDCCRSCQATDLMGRIRRAVEVERALGELTWEQSVQAVKVFRESYPEVTRLWKDMERAEFHK